MNVLKHDKVFDEFIKQNGITEEFVDNYDKKFYINYSDSPLKKEGTTLSRYIVRISFKNDPVVGATEGYEDKFNIGDYNFYLMVSEMIMKAGIIA